MKTKTLDSTKIYWLDKEETVKVKLAGLDMPHGFGSAKYTFRVLFGGAGDIVYMDSNLPKTIHEVVEGESWQFTTPIAMKCTEEQFNGIEDKLFDMGYTPSFIYFVSSDSYLVSGYKDDSTLITNVSFKSMIESKLNRIIFTSFNPDLFLALAAMTDKEDGIKGEYFKCVDTDDTAFGSLYIKTKENFSEMFRLDSKELVETGFDCANSSEFRKATAQEIIEHFEKKEFVLPYAYMVCVSSKEEYLSVLEYARTKGEFKEDFNDLTPNAFPYYIGMEKNGSWSYNNRYISDCDGVKITFDQFKKYVLKETTQSCQKAPVVGSVEYTVNVEFDSEKAAEEIFAKIVELSKLWYAPKGKELSESTIKSITEHFIEDNNRLKPNYDTKNIQKVWNDSIEHVKGSIALPIPPTKQATLFYDRVEITDWNPKEGQLIYYIIVSNFGNIKYRAEIYNLLDYQINAFKNGFIKRTESEAKQLVEKLKQAML